MSGREEVCGVDLVTQVSELLDKGKLEKEGREYIEADAEKLEEFQAESMALISERVQEGLI